MSDRKIIDWEAIEREYRAGVLSVREIAAQFNITHSGILRRAKAYQWTRDLTKRIRQRVTEKLVTGNVTVTNAEDEKTVEEASDQVVRVIELHRKDSKQQQDIIRRLMDILQERVMQSEANPSIDDVRYCGGVMRDCSQAFAKLVGIERQSYGIDTDGRRPDPIDEISILVVSPEAKGE